MNTAQMNWALALLLGGTMLTHTPATAQSYSIDWWGLDDGGGTSTGGSYTLNGTIGQPDVGTLTGGSFVLQAGFWSFGSQIVTPPSARPQLTITRHDTLLRLIWKSPSAGFVLEETSDLDTQAWSPVDLAVSDDGMTRSVTLPPTTGARFYRLKKE